MNISEYDIDYVLRQLDAVYQEYKKPMNPEDVCFTYEYYAGMLKSLAFLGIHVVEKKGKHTLKPAE